MDWSRLPQRSDRFTAWSCVRDKPVGNDGFEFVFQQVLAKVLRLWQFDRVDPVEAGSAEVVLRHVGCLNQVVQRNVVQGIGTDRFADLVDGLIVRYEFGAGGEVDPVETWPFDRRRRDSNVDLRPT